VHVAQRMLRVRMQRAAAAAMHSDSTHDTMHSAQCATQCTMRSARTRVAAVVLRRLVLRPRLLAQHLRMAVVRKEKREQGAAVLSAALTARMPAASTHTASVWRRDSTRSNTCARARAPGAPAPSSTRRTHLPLLRAQRMAARGGRPVVRRAVRRRALLVRQVRRPLRLLVHELGSGDAAGPRAAQHLVWRAAACAAR
jgi:nitroreductase